MGFEREMKIQEPTPEYFIPALIPKFIELTGYLITTITFRKGKLIKDFTNNKENIRTIIFKYNFSDIS